MSEIRCDTVAEEQSMAIAALEPRSRERKAFAVR